MEVCNYFSASPWCHPQVPPQNWIEQVKELQDGSSDTLSVISGCGGQHINEKACPRRISWWNPGHSPRDWTSVLIHTFCWWEKVQLLTSWSALCAGGGAKSEGAAVGTGMKMKKKKITHFYKHLIIIRLYNELEKVSSEEFACWEAEARCALLALKILNNVQNI